MVLLRLSNGSLNGFFTALSPQSDELDGLTQVPSHSHSHRLSRSPRTHSHPAAHSQVHSQGLGLGGRPEDGGLGICLDAFNEFKVNGSLTVL
jgi:hypothetical protein